MAATGPLRVLGIDPGSRKTGWGVVEKHGNPIQVSAVATYRVKDPAKALIDVQGYQRYVQNRIRERFGFEGAPIRVHYKEKRKRVLAPKPSAEPAGRRRR